LQQGLLASLPGQMLVLYQSHLLLHVLHWVCPSGVQDVVVAGDCWLWQL
jgi:hypothetical protein